MIIRIEPYQATLDAVQKRLTEMGKEEGTYAVLKKAINEVAGSGKELIYTETRARYTIKRSAFKKTDVVKKAMTARQGASLTVKGVTPGIWEAYKTKKNGKKKAAQGMVLKKSTMKELETSAGGKSYKAFVARMKSGHEGIFQRVPGKIMKTHPATRTSKGREAIKEIMSMSKAKAAEVVYEKNNVYAKLQDEISFCLLKHMNAVIGGIK